MNIDKIMIGKNYFKYNDFVSYFVTEEQLRQIISNFFVNNIFKMIHLYKRVSNCSKSTTKVCIFYDNLGEKDIIIVCDKEYVPLVKSELIFLNLEYKRPDGGKNKKVLK